jgi:hypothetical protein
MRTRQERSEDGSALIMVLIFMSVFGLIIAALLTESDASFGFTNAVNTQEKNVYAADAGVSFGIQQLNQNNALCPTVGVYGPPIPNLTVNGRTVSVTCDDTTGATLGADGYAIVTTSTGPDSLVLQGAAGQVKKVGGPVYVSGGVDWGAPMKLTGGNFYHRQSGGACLDPPTVGPSDDLRLDSPPYGYYCTTLPRPDPAHVPPVIPTAVQDYQGNHSGTCRIFTPGLYTKQPELVDDNYFASGVYYFNFDPALNSNDLQWDVTHATVIGGQPGDGETRMFTPVPSCAATEATGGSGAGVEWVFGGGSSLYVDTQGGVELFRRTGEATGTNRLSFVAVPDDGSWPGWAPNTVPNSDFVLSLKDGNTTDMAIHGLVYAPNQSVGLTATNTVLAQTLGGIVAYSVTMQSSASATGFSVSVEPGSPGDRHVLITACSPAASVPVPGSCAPVSGSERPVMSAAVVAVANDAARTTTVESWRTRGPSD